MQQKTEDLTPELAAAYQLVTGAGVPAGPAAWAAARVLVDRESELAAASPVRFRTAADVYHAVKLGIIEPWEARPFLGLPERRPGTLAGLWRQLLGR